MEEALRDGHSCCKICHAYLPGLHPSRSAYAFTRFTLIVPPSSAHNTTRRLLLHASSSIVLPKNNWKKLWTKLKEHEMITNAHRVLLNQNSHKIHVPSPPGCRLPSLSASSYIRYLSIPKANMNLVIDCEITTLCHYLLYLIPSQRELFAADRLFHLSKLGAATSTALPLLAKTHHAARK